MILIAVLELEHFSTEPDSPFRTLNRTYFGTLEMNIPVQRNELPRCIPDSRARRLKYNSNSSDESLYRGYLSRGDPLDRI